VAEVDFRLVELIGRDAALSLRASLGALVTLGAAPPSRSAGGDGVS